MIPYVIPTIYFTISSTTGLNMNYTIYWGETLENITSNISSRNTITNNTYYHAFTNASNRPMTYYWSVNLTDTDDNWLNESYSFKTGYPLGPGGYIISTNYATIMLFGIIGFILLFLYIYQKKKKKKDDYEW